MYPLIGVGFKFITTIIFLGCSAVNALALFPFVADSLETDIALCIVKSADGIIAVWILAAIKTAP